MGMIARIINAKKIESGTFEAAKKKSVIVLRSNLSRVYPKTL